LRRHSGLRREVALLRRRRPESPEGRALQHALAALRRLARATATMCPEWGIAGAPRLATACCSARRTTGELFRGSQAQGEPVMSATHATVAPSDIQPVAVKPRFRDNAWMDATTYDALYARSIDGPDTFWREQSQRLHWRQPPTQIRDIRWDKNDLHIRWFADGQLNAAENCIDRHLSAHADRVALYWEPDTPGEARVITYAALHQQVCKLANVLKHLGVRKGDRVTIYLPMIPEAVFAMLACARIG